MLEYLYKKEWVGSKLHALFFGFIYSVIGIFISMLLFPNNVGPVSLGFISVLLIPTFNAYLKSTVQKSMKSGKKSFMKKHEEVIKVMLLMFLGIFLAYFLVSCLLDKFQFSSYFASQLKTLGVSGYASNNSAMFSDIIRNNLIVFLICFVISLFLGAGSVLFLAWNASVWGVALNYFIRSTIENGSKQNPIILFFTIMLPFLPHLITEALAYVNAAIVGGIASKAVLHSDFKSGKFHAKEFKNIIKDAIVFMIVGFCLVLIAGAIETFVF